MRDTIDRADRASMLLLMASGLSIVSYVFVGILLFALAASLIVVGLGMLPETVLLLRKLAGIKRRQVGEWSGRRIPEAYTPLTGTLVERVRKAVKDPGTYRDLRWLVLHFFYGLLLLYVALPLWVIGALVDGVWCGLLRRRAVVLPLIVRLAALDARWSRALLKPSPDAERNAELAERVEELTVTRAGAVAAHGAELRRIERDLHDGTQARLVSLSMRVGLARRAYDKQVAAAPGAEAPDPDVVRRLLDDAQDQAEEALTELRHVVRGIHPPILTDRGLVGAVRALAASSGLEVAVRDDGVEGGPRAPAAVEAAAYFVMAEALTNAAKHSGARRAEVELARAATGLRILVRDEGRGGADESGGTGLLGMRRRVAALDGTMEVVSPAGGPTLIGVELPCVW
ncbi:sensor histidine kinase [Streptomyces flavofungini]|uniref:histidine kinase n=1 Tax=Streptomyces flavofungini TaxID=68200 RepID=A0ABS0XE60_9ACTN|nr:sensor domain-containing protein [Streptomyces flavofungini]MBJ3811475.1 sensor domain-containing protein [Streptomyces flavofungini]GHC45097.1 histidine kinase [Streptomyces flavofungini]